MGYSMINNTTLNKWELNFTPTNSGTRTVTLNTAGTFLDRNVDIAVTISSTSRTAGSGDITLTKTSGNVVLTAGSGDSGSSTNPSISLATSTPSSGVYYTLTATGSGVISGTGRGNVSTGSGWVTSGNTWSNTVTDSLSYSDTTQGYIIKSIHGNAVSGSVPTVPSGAVGIEIQPKGYIIIPAGYNPQDRYVYANAADVSGESRAASGFSLSISSVSGNSDVSVGTLSDNKYPIIANNLGITGTLTASTPGWFSTGSATDSDTDNVTVGKIAAAEGNISFAYGTTTTTSGTKKPVISKQNTPSGVTNAASGNATTTAPSSGVYVAVKTAENTATLTAKETITTAGFVPIDEFNNNTISVGATASDITYVKIATANPSFTGGAISGSVTGISGYNVSLSDTNNGIYVTGTASAGRAAVTYNGAVNGWVSKANGAIAYSGTSSNVTLTNKTRYITAIRVPKDRTFSVTTEADTALDTTSDLTITNAAYRRVTVTNSGTTVVTSASTSAGNLTVAAYDTTNSSNTTSQSIVENGVWINNTVNNSGTYYGRVTVAKATITSGSGVLTISDPAYNSTSGKFDLTASGGITPPTVNTAGYISSSVGTRIGSSISGSKTLNKISLTSEKTSGNLTVAPDLIRTAKPSDDTWVDAANGAATSTKPTSGPYVQIDAAANTNSVTIKGKVSTAGYGDTTNYTAAATIYTVGSAVATTKYIPIKTTSLSFAGGALNNKAATAIFVNANNKVISTESTDLYNNGLSVQAKGTAGRAAVTYTNSAGWLDAHSSASASGAVTTSTWDGTTYYLTGVKIAPPSSGIAKFDITVPNGNTTDFITFQFQIDTEGNVTVIGPD